MGPDLIRTPSGKEEDPWPRAALCPWERDEGRHFLTVWGGGKGRAGAQSRAPHPQVLCLL